MTSANRPEGYPASKAQLFTDAFFHDPYPVYSELRSTDPVHWDEEEEAWVLTNHADVAAALTDQRLFRGIEEIRDGLEDIVDLAVSQMMMFAQRECHQRIRSVVHRAFTPRRMHAIRAHIEDVVNGLVEPLLESDSFDVIRDIAYPLPMSVISEMLSLPPHDREQFKRWSSDIIAYVAAVDDMKDTARSSLVEIMDYMRGHVAYLRDHPDQSVMCALIDAHESGMLSEPEMLTNAVLLLMNGHETTTDAIGNGMLALLRNPHQISLLRAHPDMIGKAVEELLRFDGPVQVLGSIAVEDVEIRDASISAGELVLPAIGAANRDPARFPNPDVLDVTRSPNRHLAFGWGIHYCLGSSLARLQMQLAIGRMLECRSQIEIATEDLTWKTIPVFRGLEALPVTWE